MAVLEETYLVNVDSSSNHNKFYRATLMQDGTIRTNWGRVGATGQSQTKAGGRSAYLSLINAKERKGYSRVDVLAPTTTVSEGNNARLREAAASLIAQQDPLLNDLVDRLVAANKHNLMEASGGMISVDVSGQVTTPLGIISARSLREARGLLDDMGGFSAGAERAELTERYLRLVPQAVKSSVGRGWAARWLDSLTSLQKQYDLLDALEASVSYADAARRSAERFQEKQSAPVPDDLFRYRVSLVDPDSEEFAAVVERYDTTRQDVHSWSRALRPVRVFALTDVRRHKEVRATHKRVRNVHRYWHGTGAANVLSILQKGLFVPPARGSGIHIAGRMFGDGVYLSRSSSKSLGYSVGFWGGDGRGAESKFMFLTNTAMGNEYRPGNGFDSGAARKARSTTDDKGRPFDSINVLPGRGGVRNHEAIVWDVDQVQLSYLVEFA